jgi:hypothetical protein
MILKTKDYDIFKFRIDNREKIDQSHVRKLIESIKARNMLQLCPVVLNSDMEIIDGQHRVLAAKALGIEIYYQVEKTIEPQDIIRMNVKKSWGINDFLNFYCTHHYPEYLKLRNFMKNHGIILKVALNITMGQTKTGFQAFKDGDFKFHDEILGDELDICWETIGYIKKMNGHAPYTNSNRFWKALLKMIRHREFDAEKWRMNMSKMVDNFCAKAKTSDYVTMFQHVYNYRNQNKIKLNEEEYE